MHAFFGELADSVLRRCCGTVAAQDGTREFRVFPDARFTRTAAVKRSIA
jgi:hypothetical protein